MKTKITEEELMKNLKKQVQFLKASSQSFDEGFVDEAIRLAVTIRVLVHDTKSSLSLLSQINKKDITFHDTSYERPPNSYFPAYTGLVMVRAGRKSGGYSPVLDRGPPPHYSLGKVPFEEWWNRIVIEDKNGRKITRKFLITTLANKEGGAHVDPKLDKDYYAITRKNSLGWKHRADKIEKDILGVELASVRQISFEVLESIKEEFPEISEE